jgi:hypothetical protein
MGYQRIVLQHHGNDPVPGAEFWFTNAYVNAVGILLLYFHGDCLAIGATNCLTSLIINRTLVHGALTSPRRWYILSSDPAPPGGCRVFDYAQFGWRCCRRPLAVISTLSSPPVSPLRRGFRDTTGASTAKSTTPRRRWSSAPGAKKSPEAGGERWLWGRNLACSRRIAFGLKRMESNNNK